MKNRIQLDIVHPEKARIEAFLNNVEADLEQVPFDARELHGVDGIEGGFKFKEKDKFTSVIVIVASSYSHANEIEAANLMGSSIKWTVNGSILFGVESEDFDTSNEMLSFFAGRE